MFTYVKVTWTIILEIFLHYKNYLYVGNQPTDNAVIASGVQ